jgi:hypothetical protein
MSYDLNSLLRKFVKLLCEHIKGVLLFVFMIGNLNVK